MTREEVRQKINLLRRHLVEVERCINENHTDLDGARVSAADQAWRELHAEDGPVDSMTADVK